LRYIKSMKLPTKTIERKLFRKGYTHVVAVDEVGMGSLAGPVVVCAVVFTKKFFQKEHKNLHWIRDSKLLLPHKRKIYSDELKGERVRYQLGYCFPKTIDKLNIYQAARVAMRRAIEKLEVPLKKTYLLVDGNKKIRGILLKQQPIIKGDRKVFSIACASVIAKVFRDKMMVRYAKRFPGYGFEKHKGYGTKLHKAQLSILGPTPIHRRSFARLSFWTKEDPRPWASPKI